MKKIFCFILLHTTLSAQASYFENNCSNADGDVRWEEGHNENQVYFSYYDQVSGTYKTANFDVGMVNIKFTKKKTLLKKNTSGQCWAGAIHKYSSHALITPTSEFKEEFIKIHKASSLKDYVICHDRWDGEVECQR